MCIYISMYVYIYMYIYVCVYVHVEWIDKLKHNSNYVVFFSFFFIMNILYIYIYIYIYIYYYYYYILYIYIYIYISLLIIVWALNPPATNGRGIEISKHWILGGWKNLNINGWVRYNGGIDLKMGGAVIHSKVILVPQKILNKITQQVYSRRIHFLLHFYACTFSNNRHEWTHFFMWFMCFYVFYIFLYFEFQIG